VAGDPGRVTRLVVIRQEIARAVAQILAILRHLSAKRRRFVLATRMLSSVRPHTRPSKECVEALRAQHPGTRTCSNTRDRFQLSFQAWMQSVQHRILRSLAKSLSAFREFAVLTTSRNDVRPTLWESLCPRPITGRWEKSQRCSSLIDPSMVCADICVISCATNGAVASVESRKDLSGHLRDSVISKRFRLIESKCTSPLYISPAPVRPKNLLTASMAESGTNRDDLENKRDRFCR